MVRHVTKAAPIKTVRRTGRGKAATTRKTGTGEAATTRKTANRFAVLAGGDNVTLPSPSPADDALAPADEMGLIGAMSEATRSEDSSMRVVHLRVDTTAPHPFNDPGRSEPRPEDDKWNELVNSVSTNGVRLPVLAVPRERFLAARPDAEPHIPADAQHVLIYGHRRRAAALAAGRETIPAVVDHTIMDDNGDLDAMAAENLGRQDLSDLAEADLFARYCDLGLTQRAVALRLGVDQATVSRRLALFLMTPTVRNAVAAGELRAADAATLAGALPYGPPRRWQKSKDDDQQTDQRGEEQDAALSLILHRNMTAARAAEWVIAARAARRQAAQWGIPLVDDPEVELGDRFYEYRVAEYDGRPGLIAAIDPALGSLALYERPRASETTGTGDKDADDSAGGTGSAPEPADAPAERGDAASVGGGEDNDLGGDAGRDPHEAAAEEQRRADAAASAAAQAHRRHACAALITQPVTNGDLLKLLVRQYLSGVSARSGTSAVTALLNDWDAHAEGNTDRVRAIQAWHRAVAADELHTSDLKDTAWDDDAIAHVQTLIDRVGYQPTAWEREQLDRHPGA